MSGVRERLWCVPFRFGESYVSAELAVTAPSPESALDQLATFVVEAKAMGVTINLGTPYIGEASA